MNEPTVNAPPPPENKPTKRVLVFIVGLTASLLGAGAFLFVGQARGADAPALSAQPKKVGVVNVERKPFQPERRYVATVQPWVEAAVGPQLVSAYVDTVLVRPGDPIKRGQVLATLDCRKSSAANRALALQARALEARRRALVSETARFGALAEDGFVSPNELEKRSAGTAEIAAQISALEARLAGSHLNVNDCVLRAPFAGEVSERLVDPGAFVRPGQPVARVVDRKTVRLELKVAERDFASVAPGRTVRVRLVATGQELTAKISRRSPVASASNRTVSAEIDWEAAGNLPVGTTAEVWVSIGEERPASALPLNAARIRGDRASVFVADGNVARKRTLRVLGEGGTRIYLEPLADGAQVVLDGHALLSDGDPVEPQPARVEATL